MKRASIITGLFLFMGSLTYGQSVLTFEAALAKTLENNFEIQLSQVDQKVATNNADRSANGYLPTLSGSGAYNWTFYQGTNQLITEDLKHDANISYTYNAGLTLSYYIFEGFGRTYRYHQAVGNKELSAL